MMSDSKAPDGVDVCLDEAVCDVQMRLTYQEDEIRHLNRTLERQRADLDALHREVVELKAWIRSLTSAQAGKMDHERPPHY